MTKTLKRPLLHDVMSRAADCLIPFQASLEVTHRCNLSCKQCYIDVPTEKELSLSEIKDILDQLADSGTMYLLLTGGEPLIRRDFFDIAFYAKERGFIVMFLTNGTLITPSLARETKRLEPFFVGMSLYGATPDTHDGITKKQGSFMSTIKAIELLKGQGVTVTLQTLLMDSNIHEAEEIKVLAQSLDVYHLFDYELIPTRSGSLAPYHYEVTLADLCHNFDPEWVKKSNAEPREKKGICKAGHGICSISPQGDVFPCLLMPLKVGNLRKANFTEIWKVDPSPTLTHLRSLSGQDLADCRDCRLAKYCRKCMGIAFTETGELTKPAPSACRNAALRAEFSKRKGVVV